MCYEQYITDMPFILTSTLRSEQLTGDFLFKPEVRFKEIKEVDQSHVAGKGAKPGRSDSKELQKILDLPTT